VRGIGSERTLLAGLAAGLLILAACGNQPNASSTPGPVKLGLLGPLSGARAGVGQGMVTGANLAIDIINGHGGVLGHQIQLSTQDDAGDPGDAVPAAQKLIQSDNVVGIVGPTSLTASVVLPLADRANIPDLMWGGGAAFDFNTDPHFFRMSPSDTEQAYAMVVYAHSKGWNKVSLAIGNTSADQSLVPGIMTAAQKVGMTITTQVNITIGSTSFRSEISRLFAGKPDAVLAQFDIPSASVMFGELKQQGLTSTPWVVSNLWYATEFVTSVGKAVASGPIYIANPAAGGPGEAPFLTALKAKTGKDQPSNGNEVMWDAVISWALGVEQAKSLSWPAVGNGIVKAANGPGTKCYDYPTCVDMIRAGKTINFDGAASSVDYDKYHNVFGPFAILQYQADGTASTLTTLSPEQIQSALG
jgi:ABC-type branched-subunit amino acid transport system substrate-binding protein